MKKNLTKVMAMGMVLTMLGGMTAFANEAAATEGNFTAALEDVVAEAATAQFLTQGGKVSSVDASETDGVSIVTIENEMGGLRFAVAADTPIFNRADGAALTAADLEDGMEVSVVYDMNSPMGMSLPPYLGNVTAVVANADAGSFAVGHFDAELTDMNLRLQLNIDQKTTQIKNLEGAKIRLGAEDIQNQDALVFYDTTTKSIPAQTTPSFVLLLTKAEIIEDVTEVPQVEMVALRETAEANGYSVKWQGKNNPILLEKEGSVMEITIGSDIYVVDGAEMKAQMPGELKDGVTFVCSDIFA